MNGTIVERLKGKSRVCIDSMTLIYFIECHPTYLPIVRPLFELVHRGDLMGLCSYITLLEVLVRPLKEGRVDLARQYRDILVRSGSFSLFPVERAIAEGGAEIRAKYAVRVPDAIQLATASRQAADAFVTNDSKLKRFDRLEVLVLDDFVRGPGPAQGGLA